MATKKKKKKKAEEKRSWLGDVVGGSRWHCVAAGGGSRRSNETSRGKKIVRVLLSPSNFSMFSLFFFFFSFFSLCFCFYFFLFSSLFPFLPLLCFPLFFFPFFSLLFRSLSSLLFLCFSSSFMVLSFWSSFFSLSLSSPSIYKGEKGKRELLSLSSHGTKVGWLGRSTCSRPKATRRACPFYLFHHGGRPWGGVGGVKVFWVNERER